MISLSRCCKINRPGFFSLRHLGALFAIGVFSQVTYERYEPFIVRSRILPIVYGTVNSYLFLKPAKMTLALSHPEKAFSNSNRGVAPLEWYPTHKP